jgi:hypothetical protein
VDQRAETNFAAKVTFDGSTIIKSQPGISLAASDLKFGDGAASMSVPSFTA